MAQKSKIKDLSFHPVNTVYKRADGCYHEIN